MSSRFTSRLASRLLLHHHLLRRPPPPSAILHNHPFTTTIPRSHSLIYFFQSPHTHSYVRLLSTRSTPRPIRPTRPDIGARARQMQTRRLWTYALAFSCVAGFIVIVLNQFQDQLVFYVTPTQALEKYTENPSKTKFRLGGLVLEGSLGQIPSSPEMEFVVSDLMTDILVKYDGSLPDLFREGHSVVVEGFIRPFTEEIRAKDEGINSKSKWYNVSEKARSGECYFKATEVLAKHDEKYMPAEVASALEKNKKLLEEQAKEASSARGDNGDGNATAVA